MLAVLPEGERNARTFVDKLDFQFVVKTRSTIWIFIFFQNFVYFTFFLKEGGKRVNAVTLHFDYQNSINNLDLIERK